MRVGGASRTVEREATLTADTKESGETMRLLKIFWKNRENGQPKSSKSSAVYGNDDQFSMARETAVSQGLALTAGMKILALYQFVSLRKCLPVPTARVIHGQAHLRASSAFHGHSSCSKCFPAAA